MSKSFQTVSLLALGLLAGGLRAQIQTDSIVFSPLGYWPVCLANHLTVADSPFCAAAWQPGKEPYLLIIRPGNTGATAYRYTISGTGADGKPVEIRGLVNRAGEGATTEVIACGLLVDVRVSVEELTIISALTVRAK